MVAAESQPAELTQNLGLRPGLEGKTLPANDWVRPASLWATPAAVLGTLSGRHTPRAAVREGRFSGRRCPAEAWAQTGPRARGP